MYIKFGDYGCYHYLCTTKQRDLAQLVAHTSGGREVAGVGERGSRQTASSSFLYAFLPLILRSLLASPPMFVHFRS